MFSCFQSTVKPSFSLFLQIGHGDCLTRPGPCQVDCHSPTQTYWHPPFGKSWQVVANLRNMFQLVQIAEWLVQQKIALIELSTVYQIVHQFHGMFLWPVHNATLNMHSSIHPTNLELHHLWCSIRCVDEGVGCKIYNYLIVEFTVCTGDTWCMVLEAQYSVPGSWYIDACMIFDVRSLLQ